MRVTALAGALLGTVARIAISSAGAAEPGRSVWGYFTIQSNLMVCLFLAWGLVGWLRRREGTTGEHILHGAVLLSISITALVYNVLLAATVEASGFDSFLLQLNHTITPLLFALDWAINSRRIRYRWRHVAIWLLYPIAYGIGASIEGASTGAFRYFFLDFVSQSAQTYAVQLGMVTVIFLAVSALIVGANRYLVSRAIDGARPDEQPGVPEVHGS